MTLDEAIRHAEEIARKCDDCGKELAQLAGWLKELKIYREGINMFEDIARTWLEGCTGISYDDMVLNELVDDLAVVLMEVYEAGRSYGYDEGIEENLTELQW